MKAETLNKVQTMKKKNLKLVSQRILKLQNTKTKMK